MRDERTHAAPLGDGERLAVVDLAALGAAGAVPVERHRSKRTSIRWSERHVGEHRATVIRPASSAPAKRSRSIVPRDVASIDGHVIPLPRQGYLGHPCRTPELHEQDAGAQAYHSCEVGAGVIIS
jgi:hypothetical protein